VGALLVGGALVGAALVGAFLAGGARAGDGVGNAVAFVVGGRVSWLLLLLPNKTGGGGRLCLCLDEYLGGVLGCEGASLRGGGFLCGGSLTGAALVGAALEGALDVDIDAAASA